MFRSLFTKKATQQVDWSVVGADMHSHLLPGLDDGLRTMEESVEFIREMAALGFRKLVCTPHIMSGLYPNSPETILPVLDKVRQAVHLADINIEIAAAAEYMVDVDFEMALNADIRLLTFGPKNYILIEQSYAAPAPNFERVVFQLQMKGLKPIIAHPERYNYWHRQPEQLHRLIELGCEIQVNTLSFSGFYGKEVKKTAEYLAAKQLISFLGTDMHHIHHLEMLKTISGQKVFASTIANLNLLNKTLLS